jgi:hypothetical protein
VLPAGKNDGSSRRPPDNIETLTKAEPVATIVLRNGKTVGLAAQVEFDLACKAVPFCRYRFSPVTEDSA